MTKYRGPTHLHITLRVGRLQLRLNLGALWLTERPLGSFGFLWDWPEQFDLYANLQFLDFELSLLLPDDHGPH